MRKRQRKKKEKTHVKLYPDEVNLLFMTPDERETAINDFLKYRQKFARRRYRDLKNMKIMYVYPFGALARNSMNSKVTR